MANPTPFAITKPPKRHMKIKGHIGRTVGAVAIVGGAAAVLFTGSPAHTQFSATSTNNVVLKGSTVGETVTNGSFACSGLTPPNNAPELQTPPEGNAGTYEGSSCTQTVSFNNTGTIPESFDITINSITGSPSALAALNQLVFTVNGTPYSSVLGSTYNPFHVATIPGQSSLSAPFTISLAAETGSAAVQNAWNGAAITINYTVTATPSAS